MHIEGRLLIDLYPVAGRANRVNIRSSRLLRAAQIFVGKTPQAVLMQLPLLFSVCGIAQATAAVQVIRQVRVLPASAPLDVAYAMLIQMDTVREHLWRILIVWPAFLEEPAAAGTVLPTGTGSAQVVAARGRLVHYARIRNGRILNYQIIAPTIWNFSQCDSRDMPGTLEQALFGAPERHGKKDPVAIQHIVRSFDPCMVCTVR